MLDSFDYHDRVHVFMCVLFAIFMCMHEDMAQFRCEGEIVSRSLFILFLGSFSIVFLKFASL